MKQIKTSELAGMALDYCVAQCENRSEPGLLDNFSTNWYTWGNTHYSSNWSFGGPIIEREKIKIQHWNELRGWEARGQAMSGEYVETVGPTLLIAAMRCYVCSKLGDVVSVPESLA